MITQTVSTVETEAQALHRLAAQAHEKGIRIIVNLTTNHHFSTSATNRDKLHAVTLYSCDCRGFIAHGRCMHHALVLERYHSLPPIDADDPEPGPDGGGTALPAPEKPHGAAFEPADVVVSIVPAPRRQPGPRVENPHTVTVPSPLTRGATLDLYHADGVEIGGRMHRVGDRVRYAHRKGEPATRLGTIGTIYRTTATGRRWKITLRENDFARCVSEVLPVVVSSEEVRHAA